MHNDIEYSKIINLTQNEGVLCCAAYANTFFKRLAGLIPKKKLACGDGIILSPCKMVHTFGMKFSIDVIFVSKSNKVVHIYERMKPNIIGPFIANAFFVIEIAAGEAEKNRLKVGDQLKVVPYLPNL